MTAPILFDHDCWDHPMQYGCDNPDCDGGHVYIVNAHTGDVVWDGDCEQCQGLGYVTDCGVCGAYLEP